MLASGASDDGPPINHRNYLSDKEDAWTVLKNMLPGVLKNPSIHVQNLLEKSLDFQADLIADLIFARNFDEGAWSRCIVVYMRPWTSEEEATKFSESVREYFLDVDKVD